MLPMLLYAVLHTTGAAVPDYANVGIIFPIATPDFQPRQDGAIVIDLITMAIDEINNKTDGISDDLLPGIELRPVVRTALSSFILGAKAAISLTEANNGEGVVSVIGPFTYEAAKGANSLIVLLS